jgi:hypothetical protein
MKFVPLILALCLAACGQRAVTSTAATQSHGRYLGVGVYDAGTMWSKMKSAAPTDKSAATLDDDAHVIVVVDSNTGEVRQCGDMSGYCVRSNPWATNGTALPAALSVHADDMAENMTEPDATTTENVAEMKNAQ